jgi:hypothetical protein
MSIPELQHQQWAWKLSSDGAEQWYPRSLFKINSAIYLGVIH